VNWWYLVAAGLSLAAAPVLLVGGSRKPKNVRVMLVAVTLLMLAACVDLLLAFGVL
jgi:hypothetical protein